MSGRARLWTAAVAFAAALGVYALGAARSPLLDPELATRAAYLRAFVGLGTPDLEAERAAAEAYWSAYPDVAGDPYFGRSGRLGVLGAREHYQRHGRFEGRTWPPAAASSSPAPAPRERAAP